MYCFTNDRHSQCNGRTLATCAPGENDSLAPLPHKGSRRGARRGQTAKMFSLRTPVQPYPRLPRSLSFSPPQAPLPSYRSICLKGPRKGGSHLHFTLSHFVPRPLLVGWGWGGVRGPENLYFVAYWNNKECQKSGHVISPRGRCPAGHFSERDTVHTHPPLEVCLHGSLPPSRAFP